MPDSVSGSAVTMPSGTFWSAIATTTKTPTSEPEAHAAPIARPSGRLWANSVPTTSRPRRDASASSRPRCGSRRPSAESASRSAMTPAATPPTTTSASASSNAGSSSPTTAATVMTPPAAPHSAGAHRSTRVPSAITGSAPRPVARAVAAATNVSATTSIAPLSAADDRGRRAPGPGPGSPRGRSSVSIDPTVQPGSARACARGHWPGRVRCIPSSGQCDARRPSRRSPAKWAARARPPAGRPARSATRSPSSSSTSRPPRPRLDPRPAWAPSRPVEQPADDRRIARSAAAGPDRVVEVGNRPAATAADLVAEQAHPAEPATPDGAGGDHAAARLVGVGRRRDLDRVAVAVRLDDERGVVEVRGSALARGLEPRRPSR